MRIVRAAFLSQTQTGVDQTTKRAAVAGWKYFYEAGPGLFEFFRIFALIGKIMNLNAEGA